VLEADGRSTTLKRAAERTVTPFREWVGKLLDGRGRGR
jgi:hypothetical protein